MSTKFTVYVIVATMLILAQNLLIFTERFYLGKLTIDTIIFSSILGIIIGVYLSYKHNLPKSNMGMNCILLMLFISPYIMVSGYLIASGTEFGEMHGINLSVMFFVTLLSQIISKIVLKFMSFTKRVSIVQ